MKKTFGMRSWRKVSRIFPLLVILTILFFNQKTNGQENLLLYTTKITLQVENTSIRDILDKIEQQHKLTFSYKSGLINERATRTLNTENLPLYDVLNGLFSSDSLEFYPLGRGVVIYKPTSGISTRKIVVRDTLVQNVLRKDTVQIKIVKRDTIIMTKTDTLYDTLYIKESFPVIDTIFMDKPRINILGYIGFNRFHNNNSIDHQNWETAEEQFLQQDQNGSLSRLGVLAQINLNQHLFIKSGVGIAIRSWRENYQYNQIVTDSNTIIGHDVSILYEQYVIREYPIHFPGTDTTIWIQEIGTKNSAVVTPIYKKEEIELKYNGINQLRYFTLPLLLGFEKQISTKNTLFTETGLMMDFVWSSKGYTLSNYEYGQLLPLSKIPISPVSASISLGIGFERQINSNVSLYVEFQSEFQINSEFAKNYPIQQRRKAYGISLGLKL